MKTATVLVIGGPLVVGSRSWAIRSQVALASRRPGLGHQESPRDCRARLESVVVCPSVRLSVRLSQAGIVSKRLEESS